MQLRWSRRLPRYASAWMMWLVAACGGGGPSGPPPDTTAPTVTTVTPADNSARVSALSPITASFSEALDCASVVASAVTVLAGNTPIAGSTACSGNVLTFNPNTELPTNTTHSVAVSTAVADLAGNRLAAPFVWHFGTTPWTVQAGTTGTDSSEAIAIDAAGNLYIAGYTDGTFDGSINAGGFDAFVAKYDSAGLMQWSRQLGTAQTDSAYAVAVDSSGNVYVGGSTDGNLSGNQPNAGASLFITKYSSAGSPLWIRQFHSDGTDFLRGLAADSSGVTAVGYTSGVLFAPFAGGNSDLFVMKLDDTGGLVWGRQSGTASTDNAASVVLGPGGEVYVAGYTFGSLDGNASSGSADPFVSKYNSSGVRQWTRQFGSAGGDFATRLTRDGAGNVFVAGRTDGSLDGSANAGGLDAFVAKLASNGALLWVRQLGSAADDFAYGVAIDAAGDAVIAGYTRGDLGGNTSAGGTDAFVAKFDSDGSAVWARQSGSTANDYVFALTVDAAGSLFLGGYTEGALDGNVSAGNADISITKYTSDGVKR